ncbi:MAG: GDSL-type esterase/lipase family protein, partial [Sedimentisphaerales bacterium]|nr:GDSL-type esterase/lipase family protein [Sedimentisphaerales bacterium]
MRLNVKIPYMLKQIEIRPGQTVLFIGDSITDADRNRQCYKPFGFGYVHFVANTLLAKYPTYNLNIINRGINGNTITDLKNRWQRDCIDHKPDILSVLIGVNDVWRQFAGEAELPYGVPIDEYESTYRRLLDDTI